jgi:hypothetical protein
VPIVMEHKAAKDDAYVKFELQIDRLCNWSVPS